MTLRILGFFDQTKNEPDYMKPLTDDNEYLLGFCIYDIKSGRPMYLAKWQDKCLNWELGKMNNDISQ